MSELTTTDLAPTLEHVSCSNGLVVVRSMDGLSITFSSDGLGMRTATETAQAISLVPKSMLLDSFCQGWGSLPSG